MVNIPYNWKPRPYQFKLWKYLRKGGKRAVAVWHRRAGKDEVALHYTALQCIETPATYWHLLPEAAQARKAVWDAVNPHTGKRRIDEIFPPEIRANTRENEMMIRFINGSTWQVVGSDNYNSLVGSPPKGVVYSEYPLSNPLAWSYLKPILAENSGWAIFLFTPRGRNHGYDLYQNSIDDKDWFCETLTADDTGVFTREQLDQILREYKREQGDALGSAIFRQEFYCSFNSAVLGSVYGEWMERALRSGRITSVPYDSSLPVETAWDLGFDDATAVWFFQRGYGECRLIDYYENNGHDIEHYCNVLNEKPWRLNYGKHYVPHDAAYKVLAAGGRSIVEQAYKYGIKMIVIPATSVMNSISAARKVLDTAWFDKEACRFGIKFLEQYHFDYDANTRSLKSKPTHDFASHACDAFEIIGQVYQDSVHIDGAPKPRFLHEITANELFFPEKTGISYRERI
jgi:hypothetical protein